MKGVGEPVAAASTAVEEGDKEKKKRRRSGRRSKQNLGCGSVDGGVLDPAAIVQTPSGKASNVAFNSLPNMYISAEEERIQDLNLSLPPPNTDGGKISMSCPLPGISTRGEARAPPLLPNKRDHVEVAKRKFFYPHLSEQAVNEAIEKGNAFRASFRVNGHNRQEAYCTVEGIPIDVFISGAAAQNRAIEGDIVAIVLDPVASWTRLKGSTCLSNSIQEGDFNAIPEVTNVVGDTQNDVVDADCEQPIHDTELFPLLRGFQHEKNVSSEAFRRDLGNGPTSSCHWPNGHQSKASSASNASEQGEVSRALERICATISTYPSKRPTGRVLAIIEGSYRRNAVIGFLSIGGPMRNNNFGHFPVKECIHLIPNDAKFPEMMISVSSLPDCVRKRLNKNDVTVEMELVAARIDDWSEECFLPQAHVVRFLGHGGEMQSQIAAILFEHAIPDGSFSHEALSCLPAVPWEIPPKEIENRKDLRNLCTFTIDPYSAIDLDDALSVEQLSDDIYRVGVHIADVSYFVLPETALDTEAQIRSTSVYILRHKISMLPPLISEDLGSLNPGVDRLTFSMIWDINLSGDIFDHWIGHSVIRSCCKLSYEHAQDIIDGSLDAACSSAHGTSCPSSLHGQVGWEVVVNSIRSLHEISKRLKEKRFKDGALMFENAKLGFLFDEYGIPYDSILCERKDSNFLVEEFMLLANKTAAEVITRTFPDCALLRRHPEPNLRKLKEFKAFCIKHGFPLDISTSGRLQLSLSKIRESLKNDPLLSEIFISYASKPMQLAKYFCTGDLGNKDNDWAHYSLAVPLYTHFTSPLRRYPDIVVHRTLSAALEAEKMYLNKGKNRKILCRRQEESSKNDVLRCFTGPFFDKDAVESAEGREALSAAAFMFKVPEAAVLSEIAAYCNERKLASSRVEEAGERVYMWALLRRREETIISEGKVMALGPRFMSVFIQKLSIERRIYYSEVCGLAVEWLETTSTLVLDLLRTKPFQRRGFPVKFNALERVALVVNPSDLVERSSNSNQIESSTSSAVAESPETTFKNETEPAVFPLTLRLLSTIPVVLHAVGGDDGPVDIGVRLYMSSYYR